MGNKKPGPLRYTARNRVSFFWMQKLRGFGARQAPCSIFPRWRAGGHSVAPSLRLLWVTIPKNLHC